MFMPRAVSNAVDKIARQTVGKDWSLYASLLSHWQEIVGTDYAQVATPSKITFPHQPNEQRRGNGTLTIKLPKGLAMEFTFKNEQIRQRINTYFGYAAIGKIVIEPLFGAPPPKKILNNPVTAEASNAIKEKTKPIENSELQDALQSFGETLIRTSPAKA